MYGAKSALSFANYEDAAQDMKEHPENWLASGNQEFLLYKPAYQAKIERVLKQIILTHDHSMAKLGMGKVLNLNGLGLGAFGVQEMNHMLEHMFFDSVRKVHQ